MSETDDSDNVTPQLRDAELAPAQRTLAEILDRLPTSPGVYLMKDRRNKIIYVGKAANLRVRVRQYFQPASGDTRAFVPLLEGIVADIETVVTSNEKEALLLENNLIKQHQPRFNVKLTDDKNYLVLRLDPRAQWPRLEVVRKIGDDGASYYGPYHSATACREALRVVNRHFQLRICTDHTLASRQRPCLQYQIKRCLAPCVLPVAPFDYAEQVRFVGLFLEGKSDELLRDLRARMKEASTQMAFERAAALRDQIRALESVLESQRVVLDTFIDQDVVGFHREGHAVEVVVLFVRQGKLVGNRAFSFAKQEFPDDEILSSFLGLYYDLQASPPAEVLLPFAIADDALKAEWLSEKRGKRVEILVPQRGPRRALVELARKNASASFVSRRDRSKDSAATLSRLQRRLGLVRPPRTIECFDISHVQGTDPVASMVVFEDGEPARSRYRTYRIKHATGGDDFASMYEVLSRRFRRAREAKDEQDPWRLPDLLVVDGGKGQLGVALAAARDVGIDVRPGSGLAIVALAKERESEASPGRAEPEARVPPVAEGEGSAREEAAPAPAAVPEAAATGGDEVPPAEAVVDGESSQTSAPEAAGQESGDSPRAETEAEPAIDGEAAGEAVSTAADGAGSPPKSTPAPAKSPSANAAKATTSRPDRIFLAHAKDAIPIGPSSAEMFVLAHLRDEAHRFAVTFHRKQRKRRTLRSALADIPGIGPIRQRKILRHFGSLKKASQASLAELLEVPGMTEASAAAVHAYFAARPQS